MFPDSKGPPDQGWPSYRIGPSDHMHALGVITLNFNLFERVVFNFFSHHLRSAGLSDAECAFLLGLMNTKQRIDSTQFIFNERESDPLVRDRVDHLIRYFNRCFENRNILFHSFLDNRIERQGDGGWYPVEDGAIEILKSSKDDWSKVNRYRLDLTDLRRIADEMRLGFRYAATVATFLLGRDNPAILAGLLPRALPDKPPLPDSLSPRPLPPAPEGAQPPT